MSAARADGDLLSMTRETEADDFEWQGDGGQASSRAELVLATPSQRFTQGGR